MNENTNFPPPPTASDVVLARKDLGLTQEEAGAIIYATRRTWQNWENGSREMQPALWELFLIKTGRLEIEA